MIEFLIWLFLGIVVSVILALLGLNIIFRRAGLYDEDVFGDLRGVIMEVLRKAVRKKISISQTERIVIHSLMNLRSDGMTSSLNEPSKQRDKFAREQLHHRK
jgi:hypothetical protein